MEQMAVTTPAPVPVEVARDPTPPPPQPPTAAVALSPPPVPCFIDAINDLRHLTAALTAFHNCYDDLQAHISSVESAIDSQLKSLTTGHPSYPKHSELEVCCLTMCSRSLRRYISANLGQAGKLREEVPAALRLAKNPSKLVFDCIGRFFLQGSKAYTAGSPMVSAREASVLALECYLLAQCDVEKTDKEVKEEAGKAAVQWKKRLINEGGLHTCSVIDARGLLMFVGCFGATKGFKNQDYKELIQAGNVKEISGVLKKSSVLVARFSEVIESTVETKMAIKAADIVYTLGFEDKFSPQKIIASFLQESKEAWKKCKRFSLGSLTAVHEANKKHLFTLLSVSKCLESHNIDSSKFLPGWQINNKIKTLKKDNAQLEKKIREQMVHKRKADETMPHILRNQELKRSRYVDHQGLHEHQLAVQYDSQRRYMDSVHGHPIRSLASPPLMHGAGVSGRIPPNGATYPRIYGEAVADPAGQSDAYGGQHYGLHRDASYGERHGAHNGQSPVYDASYGEQHGGHTGQPPVYDASYGERHGAHTGQPPVYDASYGERHGSHTRQPPVYGLANLYRPLVSLEEFPGLPSNPTVGGASQGTGSDLYQFADAVVDNKTYVSGSGVVGAAAPPAVPGQHHPSYLF